MFHIVKTLRNIEIRLAEYSRCFCDRETDSNYTSRKFIGNHMLIFSFKMLYCINKTLKVEFLKKGTNIYKNTGNLVNEQLDLSLLLHSMK